MATVTRVLLERLLDEIHTLDTLVSRDQEPDSDELEQAAGASAG